MGRLLLLVTIVLLGVAVVSVGMVVGDDEQIASNDIVLSADLPFPTNMVTGLWTPIELTPIATPEDLIPPANDNCDDPATLPITVGEISSGPTETNGLTNASDDPNLNACMWGTPTNPQGYRTGWYWFQAPTSGYLHIEAVPNFDYEDDFDTVIAIYEGGTCGSRQMVACNDDYNGFLSIVTYFVTQGSFYYVEIADRQLPVNGTARINLQAWITSEKFWETDAAWLNPLASRSRHATAVVTDSIYVIGGQIAVDDVAPERTASVGRFDTSNGTWHDLAPIPTTCAGDLNGYSNTDAEAIEGKIYIPAGYVGDNNTFSGVHCIYDIATNTWSTGVPAPWELSPPAYAATAKRETVDGYFVVGGLNGEAFGMLDTSTALTETHFYAVGPGAWDLASTPGLPNGRYAHSATVLRDPVSTLERWLCVAGGVRPTTTAIILLGSTECLDLTNTGAGWLPRASLNIPRYFASSAVGPDGKWYVYGGITFAGGLLWAPEIEVFDVETNSWTLLDRRYNLDEPPRAWSHGGFAGNDLYAIGGETGFNGLIGASVVPLVERVTLINADAPPAGFLPLLHNGRNSGEPNDTLLTAIPMEFGVTYDGFFVDPPDTVNGHPDKFDIFTFELESADVAKVVLTGISGNNDYDLYLYDLEKRLRGNSENGANLSEEITQSLEAGRYYVLIVAAQNDPLTSDSYRVTVTLP